ncbi:MAG: hypothetical protein ACO1OQ_07945 [Rufibacter sp.]
MRNLCLLLLAVAFASCAPKVRTSISQKYAPLNYKEEVRVFGLEENAPLSAEQIGTVKITDNGFSVNCGYEQVVEQAKAEARMAGGNAIKITEHRTPNALSSTCHRISAIILKVGNLAAVAAAPAPVDAALLNADYALLHVYRLGGLGPLVSYDLYLGDSVICRVKNNWKQTIKIKKDGLNTLWAKTESKREIPVNIKLGQEYYVRCAVGVGAFVGRPQLELVGSASGKAEFQSIKEKKK